MVRRTCYLLLYQVFNSDGTQYKYDEYKLWFLQALNYEYDIDMNFIYSSHY